MVVRSAVYRIRFIHPVTEQRRLRHPLESPVGKKRFQQRTPAMAIGLTDLVWTEAQILRTPVYPPSKI